MPWVLQSKKCSKTARTEQVTHFLRIWETDFRREITAYFAQYPRGEEVVLRIFDWLGPTRLQTIITDYANSMGAKPHQPPNQAGYANSMGLQSPPRRNQVVQAIGLFVAILLGEMYGPENVETLRSAKNTNSTRPVARNWSITGSGQKWVHHPIVDVKNYTPHRLKEQE